MNTDERDAVDMLSSGAEYVTPSFIAQYLSNLGNFVQGGENFYFQKLAISFEGVAAGFTVEKGWIPTSEGIKINDSSSFWAYAQTFVPAIIALAIQQEIDYNDKDALPSMDIIAPNPGKGCVCIASDNLLGFRTTPYTALSTSWRSTYALLGWTSSAVPTDLQTHHNISISSMRWVPERLTTLPNCKLFSSRQLSMSPQGSPIQAYWLEMSDRQHTVLNASTKARFDFRRRGHLLEHELTSRYAMIPSMLPASFSFGYRTRRECCFRDVADGEPGHHERSPYDPFYYFDAAGTITDPPIEFGAHRDRTFTYGSGSCINTPRFGTACLHRSIGLDAAMMSKSP